MSIPCPFENQSSDYKEDESLSRKSVKLPTKARKGQLHKIGYFLWSIFLHSFFHLFKYFDIYWASILSQGCPRSWRFIGQKIKVSDFKFKIGYEIYQDPATYSTYSIAAHNSHTVYFDCALSATEYAIVIHRDAGGYQYNIVTGPCSEVSISGINNFSPFYVYTGAKSTSPQTGDFAPAYIAMISVALISCGAIFAVRAKKASK